MYDGLHIGRRRRVKGFPEFNFISVRIVNPCKAAVIVILPLRVDSNAVLGASGEERLKVIHDVVHHETCRAWLEVGRRGGEHAPGCKRLGRFEHFSFMDTELFFVPFPKSVWIAGFEEDSADSQNTAGRHKLNSMKTAPGTGFSQYGEISRNPTCR